MWPRDTVARYFYKASRQYKDRSYIHIDGETFTYKEVWDLAVQYAKALITLGVKRRDHIAVLMINHAVYPSQMIASSIVGGVFIPVNAMLTKDELKYIFVHSDAQFLVL